MAWIYNRRTGILKNDRRPNAEWYVLSSIQFTDDHTSHVPIGRYLMTRPMRDEELGMNIIPFVSGDRVEERIRLIHGNARVKGYQLADGHLIFPLSIRQMLENNEDHVLEVVE